MKEIYMLVAGGALILILGVAVYLKKTEIENPTPKAVDPLVGEFIETLNDDQQMKLMGLSLKYEDLSGRIADYLYEKVDADWKRIQGVEN